jgi:hypothetical protein
MATEQIHTYCSMCVSRCGVLATVEDGRLTKVTADPEHPNGCICVKGVAAPEIVSSPDRLHYPMRRSRPEEEADPAWVRVSCETRSSLRFSAPLPSPCLMGRRSPVGPPSSCSGRWPPNIPRNGRRRSPGCPRNPSAARSGCSRLKSRLSTPPGWGSNSTPTPCRPTQPLIPSALQSSTALRCAGSERKAKRAEALGRGRFCLQGADRTRRVPANSFGNTSIDEMSNPMIVVGGNKEGLPPDLW